ncbi:MAG: HD domain-containing protein [Candidatus Levybacteria bacterium]|nr:HD domain-containing protein [Candidatus Levybacteria bacterium]
MIGKIPQSIRSIYETFQNAGFEIYLVGGCVRDLLLEKSVNDWDFTTNATPQDILKLFPDGFYDNTFGTVGIPIESDGEHALPALPCRQAGGRQVVEVTTFRTEHGYKDRRHPETIAWGKTVEEDLARRDFTINAIALQLNAKQINQSVIARNSASLNDEAIPEIATPSARNDNNGHFQLIDPYGGQKDIQNKIIRAVGDASKRFKEDALRLMRAIRLATQLGFSIEAETLQEIMHDAALLNDISKERIRDELMKILSSEFAYEGVMLLKNTNLLEYILPALLEGIGVSQERPGRHHKEDVFTHNVLSLKYCPSTDPIVRFATLIHDIGKPKVAATDKEGLVIFYNHEIEGARIAAEISDRLRFSKKDKTKIVTLVRWHMFTVDEKITDAAVRRFIRRVGVESVKDMMDLRIGDRLGGGTQTAESWRLKLFKKRIEEQLAPLPFSINDLAIDGNDIMKQLQIKPGPKIGEILQKLFEEVDEDLAKNTKEYLLQRVQKLA